VSKEPDVGFVACIEGGVLEAQALLLFESIRLYAGRFSDCAIYALSPRAGHGVSSHTRKRLEQLHVHYSDAILHDGCLGYGPANRVAAAAHVEETRPHDILVVLDSDSLFLREPHEILLPQEVDVAVRPVDVKSISTAGASDHCNVYWRKLCRCCRVEIESVPWCESFVDRCRIRANYNGGLVVARGGLGVLRRWADFFFASMRENLRPSVEPRRFRTGTGWVDSDVSTLWGSNQAALSLAIWSTTRQVMQLPPTYNYPLHLHSRVDPALSRAIFPHLVHVHYHWLLEEPFFANPLLSRTPFLPAQREGLLELSRASSL
jgi:hypothetical protein